MGEGNKGRLINFFGTTTNEVEGYAELETDAAPGIRRVRLYEETISHVRAEHGGTFTAQFPVEFPFVIQAVAKTVVEPTQVNESYGNSVEFIDENTVNFSGHPLRVYVKRVDGTTSGRVKTFFFGRVDDADD